MKQHKFQQIRVRITGPGSSVRFNAETDKQYERIRGVYVLLPEDRALAGTALGLKVNNLDVFDDAHDVRLLTSGQQVPPNERFFLFEEVVEAGGSALEGRLTDGGLTFGPFNDYTAVIYLWLTNKPLAG
jgi:hypothetical protein